MKGKNPKAEAVKILQIMLTVLGDELANETHNGRAEYIRKKVLALDMALSAIEEREGPEDQVSVVTVREAWEMYEAWTAKKSCLACGNSPDGGATCSYGPYCCEEHGNWRKVSFPVFLGHIMRRKRMEEKNEN